MERLQIDIYPEPGIAAEAKKDKIARQILKDELGRLLKNIKQTTGSIPIENCKFDVNICSLEEGDRLPVDICILDETGVHPKYPFIKFGDNYYTLRYYNDC